MCMYIYVYVYVFVYVERERENFLHHILCHVSFSRPKIPSAFTIMKLVYLHRLESTQVTSPLQI